MCLCAAATSGRQRARRLHESPADDDHTRLVHSAVQVLAPRRQGRLFLRGKGSRAALHGALCAIAGDRCSSASARRVRSYFSLLVARATACSTDAAGQRSWQFKASGERKTNGNSGIKEKPRWPRVQFLRARRRHSPGREKAKCRASKSSRPEPRVFVLVHRRQRSARLADGA
jgi:hypothetical protein